jgi:hypothetical protein
MVVPDERMPSCLMSKEGRIGIAAGVIVGIALLLIPPDSSNWRVALLVALGISLAVVARELEWIYQDDFPPSIIFDDPVSERSISKLKFGGALALAASITVLFGFATWPAKKGATESKSAVMQPTGGVKPTSQVPPKPIPDPRIQLIRNARNMADTLDAIRLQLLKELIDDHIQRDRDIAASTRGMDEKTAGRERGFVMAAHAREEQDIRNDTAAKYRRCCQAKAMEYRDKLTLQVPGVTSHDVGTSYQWIPRPGVPDTAGLSTADYAVMSEDLRKLASAYEARLKTKPIK